ncbi:MAG TPA: hypothetical protein VI588_04750 [Candidatus Gracilibacteria bacterium]|nr:hypothetical protein [Candidatus Gracilibacteria bacterium]
MGHDIKFEIADGEPAYVKALLNGIDRISHPVRDYTKGERSHEMEVYELFVQQPGINRGVVPAHGDQRKRRSDGTYSRTEPGNSLRRIQQENNAIIIIKARPVQGKFPGRNGLTGKIFIVQALKDKFRLFFHIIQKERKHTFTWKVIK